MRLRAANDTTRSETNSMSAFSFSHDASTLRDPAVASRLRRVGAFVLRYSLVFFLLFFGALKWTVAEAKGIEAMVSHSPILSWLYPALGVQGGSEAIGVIELLIGALILLRRWVPLASAIGSIGAGAMFVVTLSFLFTTPNLGDGSAFIIKDLTLFGAALWTAGEALDAARGKAAER
jgi:uncharacterized membrane protein YkgB